MADKFKPRFVNRLKTPVGRIAIPKLETPDTGGQFPSGKYQAYLVFDEDADLSALKKACVQCAKETWGDQVELRQVQWPFREGDPNSESDVKKGEWFLGRTFIFPKSKNRPICVGPNAKPLSENQQIRGGYWCRMGVTAMSYMSTEKVRQPNGKLATQTTRGVTFLLEGVQLVREDETFGGGGVSPDFFADGEVDDQVEEFGADDPENYEDGDTPFDDDDGNESEDTDSLM